MKTKTTKILLLVLVIALALMVLASCGKDSTIEISIKDGDTIIDTISVTDGTTINVEELKARNAIQKAGYEVSGFYLDPELSEIFIAEEEITANLVVYVKYVPKTYTIGVNTDGGNKIEKITLAKGATYSIPTPTKDGYDFAGYKYLDDDAVERDFPQTGTYAFDHNVVITAKWTIHREPDALILTVKDTNDSGNIIVEKNVYEGNSYTLQENLEKAGYTFVEYRYNNTTFAATGTYSYDHDITVYAIFAVAGGENFVPVAANHYFKEREQSTDPFTYVFLTGVEYTFTGYEISSTANGTKIFIGNDKSKFTAMAPGEFIFEAKKTSDNTVSSISAKVVYDIASMTVSGDSYNNMISNATNGTSFQTAVANKSDYVMTVGKDNFIPEVSILNDSTSAINLEQANIQITSNSELTTAINGSAITFSGVSDDVVTLTLTPKYVFSNISAQIKVKINNGVNVYDNATFKAAYSNESVQTINVLRNITALLEDSDYEELHPRQTGNITLKTTNGQTVVLENRDIGTPLNKYWGGVYRRTTESDDDNLVINGNYFTIDGSKLPYIDTILDRTAGVGYNLGNVQIGMFLYRCAKVDGTTANNDIDYRKVTGHISFNNLKIEGNNIPAYAGATVNVPGEDLPLIKMSTAFNGIVCRGGTVNLDNVSVFNTNIALFLDGGVSGYEEPGLGGIYDGVSGQVQANETQAISLNVTNSLVNYSWANSVYAYNLCKVQLTNTKIGTSSGAAIHFDDKPYGGATDGSNGFSNLRSELKLDLYTSTNINNWVAGDEPWFVAYNMTGPATTIKTDMEAGANAKGLTILKDFTGTSKMNFALVVNPCQTDKVTAWANYCGGINPAIVKDELLIDEGGNPTQMGTQFWYNSTALCSFFDGSVAETTTILTNAGLANGGNIDALAANSPFIYDGSQHIGVYIKAYKYVPPQEP